MYRLFKSTFPLELGELRLPIVIFGMKACCDREQFYLVQFFTEKNFDSSLDRGEFILNCLYNW